MFFKYYIVVNVILYIDVFYDEIVVVDEGGELFVGVEKCEYFDLVMLLYDLYVSVDILEWVLFKFVMVNGFVGV